MKISDYILSEEDVKDILTTNGFDHEDGSHYWSLHYELSVSVMIKGRTLSHLIEWIVKFYSTQERNIGMSYGKSNIQTQIKTLLNIN